MALSRHSIFYGLCFCVLLTARNIFWNKLVTEQIFAVKNESHFHVPVPTFVVRGSDLNQTIDTNKTTPISFSKPLCSREEVKRGSWQPIVLDAPPYVPSTVHLRCYSDQSYETGEWKHTFKWVPSSASSGNCGFLDWDREDFCRIMKRATILVGDVHMLFHAFKFLVKLKDSHFFRTFLCFLERRS